MSLEYKVNYFLIREIQIFPNLDGGYRNHFLPTSCKIFMIFLFIVFEKKWVAQGIRRLMLAIRRQINNFTSNFSINKCGRKIIPELEVVFSIYSLRHEHSITKYVSCSCNTTSGIRLHALFPKKPAICKQTFRASTIAFSHAGIVLRDQTSTLFVLDYLTLKFEKFDTYRKLLWHCENRRLFTFPVTTSIRCFAFAAAEGNGDSPLLEKDARKTSETLRRRDLTKMLQSISD